VSTYYDPTKVTAAPRFQGVISTTTYNPPTTKERIASALERIAAALEAQTGDN